jgi:outer membrane murein-binding lipoprotein Lpp
MMKIKNKELNELMSDVQDLMVQMLQLCCDKNTRCDSFQGCELNKDTRARGNNVIINCET